MLSIFTEVTRNHSIIVLGFRTSLTLTSAGNAQFLHSSYIYRLEVAALVLSRKMTLIK